MPNPDNILPRVVFVPDTLGPRWGRCFAAVRLLGRRAPGVGDSGIRVHWVRSPAGELARKPRTDEYALSALCGAKPGARSGGWEPISRDGPAVDCVRCVNRLKRIRR